MYREYNVMPELREKVEKLLPRLVFLVWRAPTVGCFFIHKNSRSRIYPIADDAEKSRGGRKKT
jgi:hypothetical protein